MCVLHRSLSATTTQAAHSPFEILVVEGLQNEVADHSCSGRWLGARICLFNLFSTAQEGHKIWIPAFYTCTATSNAST